MDPPNLWKGCLKIGVGGVMGLIVLFTVLVWSVQTLDESIEANLGDLDRAIESFGQERWERPRFHEKSGEVSKGNAFQAIRDEWRTLEQDEYSTFSAQGTAKRDLEQESLSEETRRRLEQSDVQIHIDAVRRALQHRWSWAGIVLGRRSPQSPNHGDRPMLVSRLLQTARMLAADALRRGGDACLREAADLARLAQDASAGGTSQHVAAKLAVFRMLSHIVPRCAVDASHKGLSRAHTWFHTLVEHPTPIGRSLEATILDMGLDTRATVEERSWPVPVLMMEKVGGMNVLRWIYEAFEHRALLRRLEPSTYPESLAVFETFRHELEETSHPQGTNLIERTVRRDQMAQHHLRAALVTIAHYERRHDPDSEASKTEGESNTSDRTAEESGDDPPPRFEPPDIVNKSIVQHTTDGEPPTWHAPSEVEGEAIEICYDAPPPIEESDRERQCWRLPVEINE